MRRRLRRQWLLCLFFLLLLVACGRAAGSSAIRPTFDPVAERGQVIFRQHCATCHAVDPDTIIVGPSLDGIATRAASRLPDLDAAQYIQLAILKPDVYTVAGFPDVMPKDFGKKLTGEQLDALVAYLMTLEVE